MNSDLLKKYIRINNDTQSMLAEALGISSSRLSAKINCTKGAQFTAKEIQAIIARYDLSCEEVVLIFFNR